MPVKQKHSSDDPYNLVNMAKICKTCDDFGNVERYPQEYPTSSFKKVVGILTQELFLA